MDDAIGCKLLFKIYGQIRESEKVMSQSNSPEKQAAQLNTVLNGIFRCSKYISSLSTHKILAKSQEQPTQSSTTAATSTNKTSFILYGKPTAPVEPVQQQNVLLNPDNAAQNDKSSSHSPVSMSRPRPG